MSKKVVITACTFLALLLGVCGLYFYSQTAHAPAGKRVQSKTQQTPQPNTQPAPIQAGPWHSSITTTVFWVGETADSDNGYISNHASAWDEDWATHFGGVDTPDSRRGYYPAGFTPRENPFYFALPYSDIDNQGNPKPDRRCATFSPQPNAAEQCKNTWIEITSANKTVYAQWQDAGPFGEDDTVYVFGGARPRNTANDSAGLDVSPAVRDYLGFQDSATVRWRFVKPTDVPAGPWRTIVTH